MTRDPGSARRRRRGLHQGVAAILLVPALLTCVGPSTAPGPRMFDIRVTTSRSAIRSGESLVVRVVARNVSDSVLVTGGALAQCSLAYRVTGPGAVNYSGGSVLCDSTLVPPLPEHGWQGVSVAPGDSIEASVTWDGRTYVSTSSQVQGTVRAAPPGRYEFVGEVIFTHRYWITGPATAVTVSAP